jgi:aryl-alcohol dehydrogenase-like predicted oxidoreductase
MRYRNLGRSGLRVSVVGLGSWLTFGGSVEEQSALACIARAYDRGITFFDTANVYARGRAEEVVGRAIAPLRRDSIVLATKVFFPMGEGPNDRGLSRKHVTEQCHASLRRLGVDYVDLYQCHRYDRDTPLEETCAVMNDLVRAGKILYWGVSEWNADQIAAAMPRARLGRTRQQSAAI